MATYRLTITQQISIRCTRADPPPGFPSRPVRAHIPGFALGLPTERKLAEAAARKLSKGRPHTLRHTAAGPWLITIPDAPAAASPSPVPRACPVAPPSVPSLP